MISYFNPPSSEPRKDGTPLPAAAEGPGPSPDRDAGTDGLSGILDFVKEKRAIDFSAYKHGTINRRIALRLHETGMPDYDAYYRPTLIDASPPGGLRIWCAGCTRREEAYSIAILRTGIFRKEVA